MISCDSFETRGGRSLLSGTLSHGSCLPKNVLLVHNDDTGKGAKERENRGFG
jgi:hypothetical protein